MMIYREALDWNTMSGLIPVSWIILGCLLHSGRSAENCQSSQPSSKLVLCVSMLAALPNQYLVPPSNVNTSALAFGWTGRPFASHIAISFPSSLSETNYLSHFRPSFAWLPASSTLNFLSVFSCTEHYIDGMVDSETALKFARTLHVFELDHQRPCLTEDLKAQDYPVVDWLTKIKRPPLQTCTNKI
ncbi:hypothetical protein PoB_007445100 [Plakobranchus ocellatus]|uniref:Uncharacterized protein n=1 Tax=Plakobranchus ocellatus TaxID=259542 RepID=A0AAV4DV29_9GAST|nr:hypothetical protein PoB_007445100 [Plakobranchus ocellatus]